MTNYRFEEAITTDDGDEAAFPILVHELYSADTRSYHPPFFRGSRTQSGPPASTCAPPRPFSSSKQV